MTSRTWLCPALVGASFSLLAAVALASPQVVGDEACERYEVDIASFASCVDGKAVLPATDAQNDVAPSDVSAHRGGATVERASPQVVGDEACERYEVDIASFATCIGGRVVLPAADAQDDIAAPVARGFGRSAMLFTVDTRLGLPWLLVAEIFSAAEAGMRQGTATGCESAPVIPSATVAQLR